MMQLSDVDVTVVDKTRKSGYGLTPGVKARSMIRNAIVFADNLTRLMRARGLRNIDVSRVVVGSRQMVTNWRSGRSLPSEENERKLAELLECDVETLYQATDEPHPEMITLGEWAEREQIPISRAQSLFELGFLQGGTGTDGKIKFVPAAARAPVDSKRLVRSARRPKWVLPFQVNLDWMMREKGISNQEMGLAAGVVTTGVVHWRSGRSYPKEERLDDVARRLGCTVAELTAPPSPRQVELWCVRHNRTERLLDLAA